MMLSNRRQQCFLWMTLWVFPVGVFYLFRISVAALSLFFLAVLCSAQGGLSLYALDYTNNSRREMTILFFSGTSLLVTSTNWLCVTVLSHTFHSMVLTELFVKREQNIATDAPCVTFMCNGASCGDAMYLIHTRRAFRSFFY